MGMSDYLLWIHGAPSLGVAIGRSGSEYSADEIDFEITSPGVCKSGNFGLHIWITVSFATMVSGEFWIVTGASTSPTTGLIGRRFVLAQLTAGKHYFVPCPRGGLLRYARAYYEVVSTNPTAGLICMAFGPATGGEE